MNLYSFSALSFSYGVLLTAILALFKRKDKIAVRFLIFCAMVCGWGFPFSFWITQNYSPETTLNLLRFSYIFVVFIPITWVHFVMDLTGKKEPCKYFYVVNYVIALLFIPIIPTKLMFLGMHPLMQFKYMPMPGILHHAHLVIFFAAVPYGFYQLIKVILSAREPMRVQLKLLFIGTGLGFIAGCSIYLPYYSVPFPLYLLVLMPIYPILTGIAMIRYGLFDYQQIADAFQREKLAAIGTMAASLNHELRNPLFIAKGKIESHLDAVERSTYASGEERIKKANDVLSIALSHLNRAMDIMQRFSDFAKPFGTRNDRERVVLKEIFSDVLQLASGEFEMQKIKLVQEPTNGLSISANRRQMEEIFFNLVINACHAMGDKGGELAFRVHQPNGKVVIEISDTGPGITKENSRRIFEPFYTTKGDKGSGLGLYITKQLVERNGGKISVNSKPGTGTTFTLEFKRG